MSAGFENLEKIKEAFRSELADGNNCFEDYVKEAPKEHQIEVAKALSEIEYRFFQEREWTYNISARLESYPELQSFLGSLSSRASVQDDSCETVPNLQLSAVTQYSVNAKVWEQGGQGALHKGKDTGLGSREVVVKFLKDLNQESHFLKEAYVTANLDHPGIAAVYAKGFETSGQTAAGENGRPFYAMRLVRGETLDRRIAAFHNSRQNSKANAYAGDDFKQLIETLVAVCSTIEYAHSRGVLHCDIKPANIKCGPYNATFVLDWGSATTFDMDTQTSWDTSHQLHLTEWTSGGRTPQFASPEQVSSSRHDLTPTSDVYCIGTTLYQVLIGRPPFGQHRTEEAQCPNPRSVERQVPAQLAAICAKATRQAPEDRYPTAHDLAVDLQHWLRDEPVTALPDNLIDWAFRIGRRHKGMTILAAIMVATVVGLGFLYMGQRNRKLNAEVESANLMTQKAQAQATGEQAFALVERICQPVARDETGITLEFEDFIPELKGFTDFYLQNIKSAEDRTKYASTLANAYRLQALISYHRHNRVSSGSAQQAEGANAHEDFLQTAIDQLVMAEETQAKDPARDAIYGLFKARLIYKQLQNKGTDPNPAEFDLVMSTIQQAIDYFKDKSDLESKIFHGEAHHLEGEVYLTFRNAQLDAGDVDLVGADMILRKAELAFMESVEIRRKLPMHPDCASASLTTQNLVRREIGRGFGYLGDVQQYQNVIEQAVESYRQSLAARKELVELDESDEFLFQLARGYANFGTLARDHRKRFMSTSYFDELAARSGGEEVILADLVYDEYLAESLKIRKKLYGKSKDARYRTDLAGLYNLLAELYLFAAIDTDDDTLKEKFLNKVDNNIQALQDELYSLNDGEERDLRSYLKEADLGQSDMNRIATSVMLEIRRYQVAGGPADPSRYLDEIEVLLNTNDEQFDYESLGFDALLAYCVALNTEGKKQELEQARPLLLRKSNSGLDRLERHFGEAFVRRNSD